MRRDTSTFPEHIDPPDPTASPISVATDTGSTTLTQSWTPAPEPLPSPKGSRLFRRDFTLVVIGQIISIFGNQVLRYALPLYLLNATGSSVLFGTVLALSFLPMIVMFPIGGIIADRVDKKTIMVVLDVATAIVALSFVLASRIISAAPLIAVTMMILFAIQGAYQPAVQASIPALVSDKHMMRGNSVVDVVNSLATTLGPVVSGLVFSFAGLTPILWVSMACFCAAAIMEAQIHMPHNSATTSTNILVTGWHDVRESFRFIVRDRPVLWKMSLVFASCNLLMTSMMIIGYPVIFTQRMGFPEEVGNRLYGYSQGILAAGSVLGGLLAGVLSKKLKASTSPFLVIGMAGTMVVAGAALQTVRQPMVIYVVLVAMGSAVLVLSTLVTVQILTQVQLLTPQHLIGKVIACVMCLCLSANPIGQFIFGIVFDKIGTDLYLPFYIAPALMIVIAVSTRPVFREVATLASEEGAKSVTGR